MHVNFCEQDIQILGLDELHKLPECINAMQNSTGGVIRIEGGGGEEVYVASLSWREKPIALDGRVFRRIEGQNVISGAWARSVMASRSPCDDVPVNADLNAESVDSFRAAVISLHPEFEEFSRDEFMMRTGIFSGEYTTSAGAFMLGDVLKISAVLSHKDLHAELTAHNIWEACTDILPRITRRLSAKCAAAVRELAVNALLHANYSLDEHVNIFIESNPPTITIDNPAMITGSLRNHRLAKLFRLSGLAKCSSRGMQAVINYAPSFRLIQDMLNFRVIASLELEGVTPVVL